MALKCVLWDFGDTLAGERWMLESPPGVPQWAEVWSRVAGEELADPWNRGEVSDVPSFRLRRSSRIGEVSMNRPRRLFPGLALSCLAACATGSGELERIWHGRSYGLNARPALFTKPAVRRGI